MAIPCGPPSRAGASARGRWAATGGGEGPPEPAAPPGPRPPDGLPSWSTVLDAIRVRVSSTTEIRYAPGCGILDGDDADITAAVDAARDADVAILVLGERSGLTARCTSGETRDRLELGLPGRQAELFLAVAVTGTPVVLVLVAGRPLAIPTEAGGSRGVRHGRGA